MSECPCCGRSWDGSEVDTPGSGEYGIATHHNWMFKREEDYAAQAGELAEARDDLAELLDLARSMDGEISAHGSTQFGPEYLATPEAWHSFVEARRALEAKPSGGSK